MVIEQADIWEIVEMHIHTGCKHCTHLLAKIMYHTQKDDSIRPLVEKFMGGEQGKMTSKEYKDDIKDFNGDDD